MSWVIDASVAAEVLLRTPLGLQVQGLIDGTELFAPELLDVEVLAVLRKLVLRGLLQEERAAQAVEDLAAWPLDRVSHQQLLAAAWSWCHNVTAYDAQYLALAVILELPLLTADGPLARLPVPGVMIHNVRMMAPAG